MMLMGKNVPERNIIGKVTMFPIMPAVSMLLVTVPTSMPSEAKSIGPKTKKGMSHNVKLTFAPYAKTPTATISRKETADRKMYQITLDISHSIFVRGVRESCLNSFIFLYSEDMLTSENMGLTRMENPMRPGIRKSMYLVCCVLTVVCIKPMTDEPLKSCKLK